MDLPNDWTALLALVFVFGAKHGLDADHRGRHHQWRSPLLGISQFRGT